MQRVRMSLPYYAQNGWDVVVLAVAAKDVTATQEPELNATVPANCRVLRCQTRCWNWLRFFGCGTLGWRAWWPLFFAGRRLIRSEHFDLVYFSNTQFLTFLLGPIWRRLYGVPYAIDIQDPWYTDAYQQPDAPRPPGGWKYRIASLIAKLGEGPTYRRAAGFTSVSPRYFAELSRRYSWFSNQPQAHIPFGIAPGDLQLARQSSIVVPVLRQTPDEIVLLYTGAAGPIIPRAANLLFAGLAQLRQRNPSAARRLRFHFIGTSYVEKGRGRPQLLPLAASHGVEDFVDEVPHRIGQLASLRVLDQADALLLLGSVDPSYSPSKTYAYWLSGKPILQVALRGSHLAELSSQMGGCHEVFFDDSASSIDTTTDDIADALEQLTTGGGLPPTRPRNEPWFAEHCLAGTLTRRQCALFDACLAPTPNRTAH
jgi:hypothetical protein